MAEPEDDPLARLKGKMVSCFICKGDHWRTKCPYKDSLAPIQESADSKKQDEAPVQSAAPGGAAASRPGKYVPPSMREGGNKKDEAAEICVTNLSKDTRKNDLRDLFRPFGRISRIYLIKDKVSDQSKGFAFIKFNRREDAARAIAEVSGVDYNQLKLNVEWAHPYKDSLAPIQESADSKKQDEAPVQSAAPGGAVSRPGKYIIPSMREGGNKKGESMKSRGDEEAKKIRVTNLSKDTRENDLRELFRPFGRISMIYLIKDKVSGQPKGFAFIKFNRREDAARAIAEVSGVGYNQLKLNVEWAHSPYKDSLAPIQESADSKKQDEAPVQSAAPGGAVSRPGKYIPPSMREGGNKKGESTKSRDEAATIRVTNLSKDTRENDLQDLFRPFGSIFRIYLIKDKVSGQSKGFAFIKFNRREDAARAIAEVSGVGYNQLKLNVEWAQPSPS